MLNYATKIGAEQGLNIGLRVSVRNGRVSVSYKCKIEKSKLKSRHFLGFGCICSEETFGRWYTFRKCRRSEGK